MDNEVRDWMIRNIRRDWHFEARKLETMKDDDLRELWEQYLDWIEE